jgi:hypothetical protein
LIPIKKTLAIRTAERVAAYAAFKLLIDFIEAD